MIIIRPPFEWQPVVRVNLNGPDAGHRVTWITLTLKCGHEKEQERRRRMPATVRCYECGRRKG